MKTTKQTVVASKTVKTPVAKTAKTSPRKTTRKSNLSAAERSAIYRLAAYKAHLHKSFQADRTPAVRKLQTKLYAEAAKNTRTHEPKTVRREAIKELAA